MSGSRAVQPATFVSKPPFLIKLVPPGVTHWHLPALQAPTQELPQLPQFAVSTLGLTQDEPHTVRLHAQVPDEQVKPFVQGVWSCHAPVESQSCGVALEHRLAPGVHTPTFAASAALPTAPVAASLTVTVTVNEPLVA